ncbi:MAG TPA: acetate--CoA ligase [Rickettsiales bacterium]|nr:acetate--CoA ligase [Rickettsiales bacterium]
MFKIKSKEDYHKHAAYAARDADGFWSEIAANFHWFKKWDKVANYDFTAPFSWFRGAKTNISYNCLDVNIKKGLGDEIAIIEEANEINGKGRKFTYSELYEEVCKFSNLLQELGVKPQDRVCIYMPMVAEAAIAMLACARIGAVHCVIFAGFSAKALASRIEDCGAKILITADLLWRGDKKIELFEIVKEALQQCSYVKDVVVYRRGSGVKSGLSTTKITIWQDEILRQSAICKPYKADSEDKLFILYTSGSTGKPKGIVHTTAGYMVFAAYSFINVFNYKKGDIFFCSADIGWVTGHSYLVYGPLLCGATTLMFEGVPTYPDASRFWKIIDKHKVNIFYTAPTAIRALMQKGDEFVEGCDLSSLKTLGTVGEPINEEAWKWYHEKIGKKKCAIIDSWWQTETGGIMISSLSGVLASKPAFAGFPLAGIFPILLDEDGKQIKEPNKVGNLCIAKPWPGMICSVFGDEKKFHETYFARFPGYYFAGDGAFFDNDGLFRIIGRIDDVINVSGHRLGTAEIENAINMNKNVAESAVIGFPHDIKGEGICAFVIPKQNAKINKDDIIAAIKNEIGSIAKPDKIYILNDLPKTRSGKIMRRILKKIINGEQDFGDVSTLLNPDVIGKIKELL